MKHEELEILKILTKDICSEGGTDFCIKKCPCRKYGFQCIRIKIRKKYKFDDGIYGLSFTPQELEYAYSIINSIKDIEIQKILQKEI